MTGGKNKKSKMTLDKLAQMTQGGFLEVNKRFDKVDGRLDKVDGRLDKVEASVASLSVDMQEVKERLDKIEATIADLVTTLDTFLKRLTDREEEFKLLKREMSAVKKILKEKLNADIDAFK